MSKINFSRKLRLNYYVNIVIQCILIILFVQKALWEFLFVLIISSIVVTSYYCNLKYLYDKIYHNQDNV